MRDKVVFITGAKGGLGSFITRRFLETGATVVGASRSISQQDFPGPNFAALAVDFTKAVAVNDAVQSVITRFGRLDVLVHLLGGFAGGQTVAETDDATWERMRDLNLTSSFYVLRAAVPHLRKSGKGRIVAIGSLTAVEPHPQLGAYITFKAALAMLVRTVALENKDAGLTANVVLPGTMDTPENRKAIPNADFSKWIQPSDVVNLVPSLTTERASRVTGAAIPIGGRNVRTSRNSPSRCPVPLRHSRVALRDCLRHNRRETHRFAGNWKRRWLSRFDFPRFSSVLAPPALPLDYSN